MLTALIVLNLLLISLVVVREISRHRAHRVAVATMNRQIASGAEVLRALEDEWHRLATSFEEFRAAQGSALAEIVGFARDGERVGKQLDAAWRGLNEKFAAFEAASTAGIQESQRFQAAAAQMMTFLSSLARPGDGQN